jgi:trigger factor
MIKAQICELDEDGNLKEGGIVKDDASVAIEMIKDKESKSKFKGARTGDHIDLDLKKAFPNTTDISSMLNIGKEDAEEIKENFRFIIREIKKFEKAGINQELFDKIFGKENVKSEEDFRNRIKVDLEKQLMFESEHKLAHDIEKTFVKKVNPELPSEFLLRWLKETQQSEKVSEEDIEKEFHHFEESVKWDLIKNKIIKENDIRVDEQEILQLAKLITMQEFQQYGMGNLPDEQLEHYAREILNKSEDKKKLYDRKYQEKVVNFIRENVKLDEKEVQWEEFQKMMEKEHKDHPHE